MNKYLQIIFFSFMLYACNTNKNTTEDTNDSISVSGDTAIIYDSSKENIVIEEDIVISYDTPEITPLPFSGDGDDFVIELIKRSPKLYHLPFIKKLEYFPIYKRFSECPERNCIDFNKPAICPEGGSADTSVFRFKRYRYKLPDIYKYQSYIVCDTLFSSYGMSHYPRQGDKCRDQYFREHCYLILYDSLTQGAKAIALHHPSPSKVDNPQARTFIIDKNYIIHLQDYWIDDDGMDYVPADYTFKIQILLDGEFEIIKNKR